jgi:choline dehydrogenase-like flavoprotein
MVRAPYSIDHLAAAPPTTESDIHVARLFVRAEPSPNPESRVTLGDARDALGQPKVKLDWRLTRQDQRNLRTLVELFGRIIGSRGLGREQILLDDAHPWPKEGAGAAHHMGTTRMSTDPRTGVVDEQSRVHGVANLFVAGSSVFPTASYVNPTLTITALSLRLADHLQAILAR